jgi:putative Ca2+/H+ antiporter (TMEM165/GDT1 family)
VAELVGDKSIYTVSSLAVRFRPVIVFGTMAVAFGAKMLAVVFLGKAIFRFDSRWTGALSACAFFVSALMIWFNESEETLPSTPSDISWMRIVAICFGSLFFTEWGDTGQIAAAALTAKSGSMLAVWLGGTLAMMTKGALAITIGRKLRQHLPQRTLRAVASVSCGVLGIIALGSAILH